MPLRQRVARKTAPVRVKRQVKPRVATTARKKVASNVIPRRRRLG